jgi:hypothetical protein
VKQLRVIGSLLAFGMVCNAHNGSSQTNKYSVAFDAVWKDVQENFYDPSFLGVDWNGVGEKYRTHLSQVRSDDAFVALIREMLRQLPTSHLGFRTTPAATKIGIGVAMMKIEGREVVTDLWYASDAMQQGLHDGDIILSSPDSLDGRWGTSAEIRVGAT